MNSHTQTDKRRKLDVIRREDESILLLIRYYQSTNVHNAHTNLGTNAVRKKYIIISYEDKQNFRSTFSLHFIVHTKKIRH